ncbi:magnesium transporter CorA family protein [Tabrizicola sp.]|uniref:magnesium transporter CorA family protein n=1 Tax=Tabrizicola sp. TaxID=2005166 RepID=UPI002610F64E|nr:magnesium transporter CorA family protein [Tabrizicola sp.]MDM7933539.1 magnesium transporter CorA family protein [Tabrizicola sp.]
MTRCSVLTAYRSRGQRLERLDLDRDRLLDAVWIDLEAPSSAEEKAVETALGIGIPTREDMQEIEVSSRIYRENGALFLTAQILATVAAHETEIGPVTFVVLPDRLVSVHYHRPGSLTNFADRAVRHDVPLASGMDTLLGLLEAAVDRLADILEGEARKLDLLSTTIFEAHRPSGKSETLGVVLERLGRGEDLNGKVNESLGTLQRLLGHLTATADHPGEVTLKGRERQVARTILHDVRSLKEVSAAQAEKVRFLLDATLGVISIRQSDIIKIFSVVAFVFLPPTLIASIYGMNFVHMPELEWPWGYPMALGLMLLSALVPWAIFRWKKWL